MPVDGLKQNESAHRQAAAGVLGTGEACGTTAVRLNLLGFVFPLNYLQCRRLSRVVAGRLHLGTVRGE